MKRRPGRGGRAEPGLDRLAELAMPVLVVTGALERPDGFVDVLVPFLDAI